MAGSPADFMYLFYVLGLVMALCLGGYSAYWSFGLRRALKVRAYSRQALIVGSFSIYGTVLFLLFYWAYFLAPGLRNSPVGTTNEVLYVVLAPVVFAWEDSSIRVGRRSDPLLRDPLRWSRLRLVLWPILLLTLAGYLVQGTTSEIGVLSYIVVGVSVVPILMAARRSGDQYYRRSLEWFGVALFVLVVQNLGFHVLITGPGTGMVYTPEGFVWSIFANFVVVPLMFYGIYKCARSLVPLNRISF